MATNLVLGYAHIPQMAVSYSMTPTSTSTYQITNLWGGNKADGFLMEPKNNAFSVRFDLSTTPLTADFVFMSKANEFINDSQGGFTIRAGAIANNTSNPLIQSYANGIIAANLCGPDNEEFVDIFAETAPAQYWSINYATASPAAISNFAHSKLFLGKAFDPGMDPNAPATITRFRTGGFRRKSSFSFQFTWEGMSYGKAVQMYQRFYLNRRFQPVVLMTRDWHDILMGNKAILCRMTEMSLPPRITDYCDVIANFEELI